MSLIIIIKFRHMKIIQARYWGIIMFSLIAALSGCNGSGSKDKKAGEDETVKIGILHSLSGTMAISEVSLKDVVLMAVDEINAKGGVLGKKI